MFSKVRGIIRAIYSIQSKLNSLDARLAAIECGGDESVRQARGNPHESRPSALHFRSQRGPLGMTFCPV